MLIVLAGPSEDPISLVEARNYLRIAQDGDDNSLSLLIKAACERVENKLHKALVTRKLRQSFSSVEITRAVEFAKRRKCKVELIPAFNDVTSISAINSLNVEGNMVSASLSLVSLIDGKFILNNYSQGLEIEYFTGFGNAANVPNSFKLFVLEELGRIIQNRDNEKYQTEIAAVLGARL